MLAHTKAESVAMTGTLRLSKERGSRLGNAYIDRLRNRLRNRLRQAG